MWPSRSNTIVRPSGATSRLIQVPSVATKSSFVRGAVDCSTFQVGVCAANPLGAAKPTAMARRSPVRMLGVTLGIVAGLISVVFRRRRALNDPARLHHEPHVLERPNVLERILRNG